MPYPTLDSLPDAIKKLPKTQQRRWRAVWTSAYNKAKKDGKSDKEAEQTAFTQANGVVYDDDKSASERDVSTGEIVERVMSELRAEYAEPNAEYLTKLKDLIRSKVKDGDISDDDVKAIIKAAAGYAGGKARARKRQEAAEFRVFAEGDALWVGYWLPEDVAAQIAIPGGEAPEDLHMTMVYIKGPLMLADAAERVQSVVQTFSMTRQAIEIKINGAARFEGGSHNDYQDVIYAVVSSPDVQTMRFDLCYELSKVGIDVFSTGDWEYTPHITLAYIERDADMPAFTLPNLETMLDTLTVATDKTPEARTAYPLSGPHFLYGPMRMSEFIEPPATIAILPKPGTYQHPVYGEIEMDEARIEHFMDQFEAGVYQDRLPIDLEHETKLSGAAGWIIGLVQNDDGSVDANVEWTDRGREALERDRYAFISPEWYNDWTDPISGVIQSDILVGAALTTRPFFKSAALRPLAASEPRISPGGPEVASPNPKPETQTASEPKTVTLSEEEARSFREWQTERTKMAGELETAKKVADQNAEQTKQMAERVQTIERERRSERFLSEVTGRSAESDIRWFGEPQKHVAMLEHLATSVGEDSEIFKDYVSQQREIGKQAKGSALFRELGTSGGDETLAEDPQVRIAAMAQKRASEKGINIGLAQREIARENPELAHRAALHSQVKV